MCELLLLLLMLLLLLRLPLLYSHCWRFGFLFCWSLVFMEITIFQLLCILWPCFVCNNNEINLHMIRINGSTQIINETQENQVELCKNAVQFEFPHTFRVVLYWQHEPSLSSFNFARIFAAIHNLSC